MPATSKTAPHQHIARHAAKFAIVGGACAALNFSIYETLIAGFGVWYVAAACWAYALSAGANFILNKLWTFRNGERGRAALHQAVKFLAVQGTGLTVNVTTIYVLTEFLGLQYRLSWVAATAGVAVWNFLANRHWTFRRPNPALLTPEG